MTDRSEQPYGEIARLARKAEEAYEAMYEASRHGVRDHYEDAMRYLAWAIELAESAGLAEEAAKLKARKDHVYNVYTHQFR